jgi:hypothetical protein
MRATSKSKTGDQGNSATGHGTSATKGPEGMKGNSTNSGQNMKIPKSRKGSH